MTSEGEQGHRGNVIRLFDEKERTEQGWARRNEALMHYLDRSGRRQCARVRALLEDWFSRYPQEHRRHLRGQMFSDSDSKQRSAWWELYLHESFVRAGCSVEVSSGTPDFLIESECGRFYVEATARFEDPTDIARERRENALLEELDVELTRFGGQVDYAAVRSCSSYFCSYSLGVK
jgi:hypothetical protein